MTIVKLRICDEDREKFGGPEWVTFDSAGLDDIPWTVQHEWEMSGIDLPIDHVLRVEWPHRMARGKACIVWLARAMAGIPTPHIHEFTIKTNSGKLQIVEESAPAGGVVPPGDPQSSMDNPSKKPSRASRP